MVAELERALSVELARAGNGRYEDTNVLPPAPRGKPSPRRPRQRRVAAAAALLAAIAAAAGVAIALRPQHQPRPHVAKAVARPLAPQPLVKVAVYDPFGDGIQNGSTAPNAIAGNPNSYWESEDYSPGGGLGPKPGLGLDVEAKVAVPGRQLQISTPLPGATVAIYAQNALPTETPGKFGDWGAPVGRATLTSSTKIPLSTRGRRYRYYLIWITKLPPEDKAALADVRLFS
jgi:eukaryotic-like serine/threonine-protein kinase